MNDEAGHLVLGLPTAPIVRVTVERQRASYRVAILHCPTERARVYSDLADLDAVAAAVLAGLDALLGQGR